jgi:hypothetical protein
MIFEATDGTIKFDLNFNITMSLELEIIPTTKDLLSSHQLKLQLLRSKKELGFQYSDFSLTSAETVFFTSEDSSLVLNQIYKVQLPGIRATYLELSENDKVDAEFDLLKELKSDGLTIYQIKEISEKWAGIGYSIRISCNPGRAEGEIMFMPELVMAASRLVNGYVLNVCENYYKLPFELMSLQTVEKQFNSAY